jgi:type I restriction enzyme, S subunit
MSYSAYSDHVRTRWDEVGSAPVGWEARRLKFSVSLRNEKIEAEFTDLEYMGLEHIESWTGRRIDDETASSEGVATRFLKDDVLFGKLRPYLAKVYLADEVGMATTEALVLMSESVLAPAFLKYVLLSEKFIDAVSGATFGAKMPRANWETIGGLPILLPTIPEQRQIAAFLDWKTSQIDALIAKKQELLEKLKEKRLAVITRAVTKGLNPDAPMRDSGISWLGEVPKHWEVKKLKFVGDSIIGLTYDPNDISDGQSGILVLRANNIQDGKLVPNDAVYVDTEIHNKLRLIKEDILICSRNGSRHLIGKCGLVTDDFVGCTFGAFNTVFRSQANGYIYYVLNSSLFEFQSGSYLTSTINQLTIGTLNSFLVPLPPPTEQTQIVESLKVAGNRFEKMITHVQAAIARLTEYRTAVITAATTGKIDVREVEIGAMA